LSGLYGPASDGQSLDDSGGGALPATTAAACDRGKIVEVKRTRQHLLFQLRMLKSLEARAKANDGRIRNEITLVYIFFFFFPPSFFQLLSPQPKTNNL
jgi:hypothetical protein